MKKQYTWLSLLVVVILASCQDKVTNLDPENRINTALVFSTPEKMELAVIGCYNSLQTGNMFQARALVYADVLGEDVINRTSNFGDIPRYTTLSSNAMAASLWQYAYKAIADANRVIAGIRQNISKTTPEQGAKWIAEAKFVRAIAHFYLVNLFAQPYNFTTDASHLGVPVMTQAFYSNDPAANKPRSTVKEVYAQVLTDLEEALNDLPPSYSTAYMNKTRATKAAAASLLSRVYLYKEDWANAKTMAWNVITGQYGTYGLNTQPGQCFGANNYLTNESIFSIPNKAGDFEAGFTLTAHYTTNTDLYINPNFLNPAINTAFAADDKRRTQLTATNAALQVPVTLKYGDVADWAPMIRYAEVLLNYAEAAAKQAAGVDAEALKRLNEVRDRSRVTALQYTTLNIISQQQLIDAVLAERRIELAFEGHRIFDLNRNKMKIRNKRDFDFNTPIADQDFGADKRILPIPLVEIERSSGVLEKNPGY